MRLDCHKDSGMPWAQGVGRSNRPAPTNLLLIPKEIIDRRSIAFAVPLCRNCAKTRTAFVRLPVEFRQRLSFHLQLHLRVLLEHLGVGLTEQSAPLVRNAAGSEPGGVRRAEIVDGKYDTFARPLNFVSANTTRGRVNDGIAYGGARYSGSAKRYDVRFSRSFGESLYGGMNDPGESFCGSAK